MPLLPVVGWLGVRLAVLNPTEADFDRLAPEFGRVGCPYRRQERP